MLLRFLFLLAFFAAETAICVAQLPASISGVCVNEAGQPIPGASVVLLKPAAFVAATISNDAGIFILNGTLQKDSTYTLQVSYSGFQSIQLEFVYPDTAAISKLVMTQDKNTLTTVNIAAQKQLITRRADRYIINVDQTFLANVGNGMDVLQKSPGLWVNADGSIRMKGNQPVMVMINDIVQKMSPEELADYLKNIPSEQISKIEVIQNPPAEYEAAGTGGIVHIILKKARQEGFTAALNNTYRVQGKGYFISSNGTVDYKIKKLYLSANGSLARDRNDSRAYTNIIYPDQSLYNTNGTRDNDNRRQFYRFMLGYDIAPGHFVGAQHMRVANKFSNTFNTRSFYKDANAEITGDAFTNWQRKPVFITSTLNYSWKIDSLGAAFKLIADRTHGDKYEMNALQALYDDPVQNLDYRIFTPIATDIYTIQADLSKSAANQLLWNAGIKFNSTSKDNQFIREDKSGAAWVKDTLVSNHFLYKEQLLMAYAAIEKTMGKTAVKAGLRAEETFSRGKSVSSGEKFRRSFLDFFPSLFINHSFNESKGHSGYVSYSRRVERPGFRELNPYRLQFDNQTIMLGNPFLLPQYTHAFEAGFTWRKLYSGSIYFNTTRNVIGQLASPVAGNIIEYQYQNLDENKVYGVNLAIPVRISKSWQVSNSIAGYHTQFTINKTALQQSSLSAKTTHSITLPKAFDIDLVAEYRSAYVNANTLFAAQFATDLSLSRKLLKNKARLRLYCSDIFNTAREKEITRYAGTYIFYYQKRQTRNFALSFNYAFSAGKKFSAKKIEANGSDR